MAARSWVERFGSDFKRSLREKAQKLVGAPREVVQIDMSDSFGGSRARVTGASPQVGEPLEGGQVGMQWLLEGDQDLGARGGRAVSERGRGGRDGNSASSAARRNEEYVPRSGTKKDLRAAMEKQQGATGQKKALGDKLFDEWQAQRSIILRREREKQKEWDKMMGFGGGRGQEREQERDRIFDMLLNENREGTGDGFGAAETRRARAAHGAGARASGAGEDVSGSLTQVGGAQGSAGGEGNRKSSGGLRLMGVRGLGQQQAPGGGGVVGGKGREAGARRGEAVDDLGPVRASQGGASGSGVRESSAQAAATGGGPSSAGGRVEVSHARAAANRSRCFDLNDMLYFGGAEGAQASAGEGCEAGAGAAIEGGEPGSGGDNMIVDLAARARERKLRRRPRGAAAADGRRLEGDGGEGEE